jgi:sugar (pentulose or hexulose) kinase
MDAYYLVFDAGTGAGRCAVVDQNGGGLYTAYQEWEYERDPIYTKGIQFNAEHFINTLWDVGQEALKGSGISGNHIRGVTVTSLREGVLFLDARRNEIYAGPNFDDRAEEEGALLHQECGPEIYFTSGTYPPEYGYAARVKWFQKNHPKVYEKIDKILTFGDWVVWKLCGEFVAEPSLASSSGLFGVRHLAWSGSLCNELGINRKWLPPVVASGKVAGSLTPEAAELIGIPADIPVIVAGGDTQCALLGMGLTKPGQTGCVAGTTSPVQRITSKPVFDPQMHTWTNCYLLPDLWCLESSAIVTGLSIRWLRDSLCPGLDYEQMNTLCASAPVGSKGTQAFLGAEVMDMTKYKGTWRGGFLFNAPPGDFGLGEIIRASWESIAYSILGNVEQITRICKSKVDELHICGGQTASKIVMQIIADVLGISLIVHSNQCSVLGAAVCAAFGDHQYSSLVEAVQNMTAEGEPIVPDLGNHKTYKDHYQLWISNFEKIRKLQVG